MQQIHRLCVAFTIAFFTSLAVAGPPPQKSNSIISAVNASQLRPIGKLDKQVSKILKGTAPGEMIFHDWRKSVEVVDEIDFRTVRTIADSSRPDDFALSKDGRFMAWNERDSRDYVLLEIASGKRVELKIGENPGFAGFSPDGQLLAIGDAITTASDLEEGYCELRIYDTKGQLLRTLEGARQGVLTPVFSPDGKILAVGNRNYETRLFEAATGKLLHTLPRRMTHELAFRPDGKVLAVTYVDGAFATWDVATGEMLRSQPADALGKPFKFAPDKELYTLDWSPKGDVLVTAGLGGKIVVYDPHELKVLKELEAPKWVNQVRFTADGSRLLSSGGTGSKDRQIVIWAVPDDIDK